MQGDHGDDGLPGKPGPAVSYFFMNFRVSCHIQLTMVFI